MQLLALRLQEAGLEFMSAKAAHSPVRGLRIDEIVCATREDADRVDVWAQKEGFPVQARVATPEEFAEWKKWQEMM